MRSSKLQQRIRRREKQKEHLWCVSRIIQGVAIVVATTALVSYSYEVPKTNAYFTDTISTLDISVNAEDFSPMRFMAMNSASLRPGSVRLYFNVHRFEQINLEFTLDQAGDLLIARFALPVGCVFTADDILTNEIGLFYNGIMLPAYPVSVDIQDREMTLTYTWSGIQAWIDTADLAPSFQMLGKGMGAGFSGLGEKFTFAAMGQVIGLEAEVPPKEVPPEDKEALPESPEGGGENPDPDSDPVPDTEADPESAPAPEPKDDSDTSPDPEQKSGEDSTDGNPADDGKPIVEDKDDGADKKSGDTNDQIEDELGSENS